MNKTELISAVAAATELSRKDADKAVNAAVQVLAAGGVIGENAAAVAATAAAAPVTVTGAEAVRKSYPSFWEEYKRLGGSFDVL